MAEPLDPNDLVTLEELSISNMCETAALVEVLEKKGLLTKQDIIRPHSGIAKEESPGQNSARVR